VAREREQGTFDQLLVTPLTPDADPGRQGLPPIAHRPVPGDHHLSDHPLLVPDSDERVRSWLLYRDWSFSPCATVGIGLSISALSLNMQQAMLYTFLLIMPLMLLSGLLTPVRNMPERLQARRITYANPLRFGMESLVRRVYLEGAGSLAVLPA
jgi:ABC-2 type transport system permease protein